MGAAVCEAVAGADDMALVVAVAPSAVGEALNGVHIIERYLPQQQHVLI